MQLCCVPLNGRLISLTLFSNVFFLSQRIFPKVFFKNPPKGFSLIQHTLVVYYYTCVSSTQTPKQAQGKHDWPRNALSLWTWVWFLAFWQFSSFLCLVFYLSAAACLLALFMKLPYTLMLLWAYPREEPGDQDKTCRKRHTKGTMGVLWDLRIPIKRENDLSWGREPQGDDWDRGNYTGFPVTPIHLSFRWRTESKSKIGWSTTVNRKGGA